MEYMWTSEGGFWSGSFRRSYPGSFCVFATTVVVLALNHGEFSPSQLVYLYSMLPYWMTMTEAFAPHTNDGPFMNLMGCGLLAVTYLLIEWCAVKYRARRRKINFSASQR